MVPQLDEEQALLRYMQLHLEMMERDDRDFDHQAHSANRASWSPGRPWSGSADAQHLCTVGFGDADRSGLR